MGDTAPSGTQEGTGNMRANILDVSKERNNRGKSETSRVLLKCIPDSEVHTIQTPGTGVSPEFMHKNQKLTQTNDPWYIPVVPTGKSEFS